MNELISILKQEIINKEELLNNKEFINKLEEILNKLDNNISNLTKSDALAIKDLFSRIEFAKLKNLCNFIIDLNGIDDGLLILSEEDNKLIDLVKDKVKEKLKELKSIDYDKLSQDINKLKEYILKLSNYGEELINKEDMENILNILISSNTSSSVIQSVFLSIANHNEIIFTNYEIMNSEDIKEAENEISLNETNINKEDVNNLLNNYNLDINMFNEEYLNNLCLYGSLERFRKKLDILKENNLYNILKNSDILYRILLYTSVEDLNKLIDYNKKYNLNEVFNKYPTVFYRKVKRGEKTGSLDNLINNVKFLEDNSFDVQYVIGKCPIFCTFSSSTVEKNYKICKLYGIDFKSDESFTFLNASHLEDNIDLFIESGLLDYAKENKSRLMQSGDIICARVKYAKKLKDLNDSRGTSYPFREYTSVDGKKKNLKKEFIDKKDSKYGKNLQETYELYGKVKVDEENTDIYSKIIKGCNSISISNSTIHNKIIIELDNLFKESEMLYNINGVKISRLKVLRLLETFLYIPNIEINNELLRFIISYNSMLDENELNIIKDGIKLLGVER